MDSNKAIKIAGAIIIPHLGGIAGSQITRANIKGWYEKLNLPSFRPPNWVFAPAWTTLYTGMGYASYLVWRDGGGFNGAAKVPLMLYGFQLALNWSWTPIFFGLHNLPLSVVNIFALTASAGACAVSFYNVNPMAGLLMVPYVAWLSFASLLNYTIYKNNPKSIEEKKD